MACTVQQLYTLLQAVTYNTGSNILARQTELKLVWAFLFNTSKERAQQHRLMRKRPTLRRA
eukprot:6333326-Amphidinium_carterae.2